MKGLHHNMLCRFFLRDLVPSNYLPYDQMRRSEIKDTGTNLIGQLRVNVKSQFYLNVPKTQGNNSYTPLLKEQVKLRLH